MYFLSAPPMLVYDSNGVMKLSSVNSTTKRKVIYYGDTQTPWNVMTDGIDSGLLIQAPGTPDTVTYGNYMGGGYDDGGNYVYAFSGFTNPILPPEYRAFIGTRNQSDYIYTALVSKAYKDYKDGLGTFVVEAPIVDLDTSVVPNVSQAWVCAGAFESGVKLLSVWLQE